MGCHRSFLLSYSLSAQYICMLPTTFNQIIIRTIGLIPPNQGSYKFLGPGVLYRQFFSHLAMTFTPKPPVEKLPLSIRKDRQFHWAYNS